MGVWTEALPYFSARELRCPLTETISLNMRFAVLLPALRVRVGHPLACSSVCRSTEHNVAVGGHPRSLHLMDNPVHPTEGTMAADVLWWDWSQSRRSSFANVAWSLGWSLGLHPDFVHIDRRADIGLGQNAYTYADWTGPTTGFDSAITASL